MTRSPARNNPIPIFVLMLFLVPLLTCTGCSGGGGGFGTGEQSVTGTTRQDLTGPGGTRALPPETLAAIEENAQTYAELQKTYGGLPDHQEMRDYFLAHNATALTLSATDYERFIFFPPGAPPYLFCSGIPFVLGGLPGETPILFAMHGGTSDSLPLPGMTASKGHFLIWSGWSVYVPTGVHTGDIIMHYQDGTSTTLELIQGR